MVRRRRDQPDARRGVPGLGDPRVDLAAGQLAALTGLGPLRDLDLQVVRADQVLAGHAEPAGGDLLDRRAAGVAVGVRGVAVGVLAALAGVAPATEPVHGDGQRLVHLLGDRAVGDGAGGEPLDDRLDRLDLVDRHRRAQALPEAEQPAQRHQPVRLLVDLAGVVLEDVVAALPGGVLQLEHRLRVEQVQLALAPPLVLAADLQRAVVGPHVVGRVGAPVRAQHLLGQHVETDPAEPRGGAGEAGVDDLGAQPEGLEDLRAGVGGHGGDAHLGHRLAHALAQRLDQVLGRRRRVDAGDVAAQRQVLDGGHGQVRVDRGRAVADQQRDVVHLAGVAGLDDQPDPGAGALAHQVVVHRAGEQQRRDRRVVAVDAAAGQHDQPGAVGDGPRDLAVDLVEALAQPRAALGRVEDTAHDVGGEARVLAVLVDLHDLGQVVVAEHRERHHDRAAAGRAGAEQVLLRAELALQGGDQLLPDRVQRRVGDLREQLGEVVVELPRARRDRGQRGVVAHRADRLGPARGHRLEQDVELLLGVAERLLTVRQRGVRGHLPLARGQVVRAGSARRAASPRRGARRPARP